MSDCGKGDKRRPTDEQKYRDNWDAIFKKKEDQKSQEKDDEKGKDK